MAVVGRLLERFQAERRDTGMPSRVIRFGTEQPIRASVFTGRQSPGAKPSPDDGFVPERSGLPSERRPWPTALRAEQAGEPFDLGPGLSC